MKPSEYDMRCSEEFSILERKVGSFFINDKLPCPYHLPCIANFHQAMFGPLDERNMELFLSAGYRRNGNSLYNMECEHCHACVSIRLCPQTFEPSRKQKRVLKRNGDVEIDIGTIQINRERLDLCESFLQTRYPQKKNHASGYYSYFFLNGITATFEITYRLAGKLLGVAIIDVGKNWMNAVYFYFDVELAERSPGVFNILNLINLCREKKIEHLYLGYTISQVSAMNYKEHFYPHYLFENGRWVEYKKKM